MPSRFRIPLKNCGKGRLTARRVAWKRGAYDIIFDGPAFVGWRMAKLEHVPLVKFPGKLVFVLAVKRNQDKINTLRDMGGRTVCAFPTPNLATLTVLDEFDNRPGNR